MPDDEYCFWHKKIPNKLLYEQQVRELRSEVRGAYLRKADLTGIDLYKANLIKTDFQEACLIGANISNTNFGKANLSHANLKDTKFQESKLNFANLSYANLSNSDLTKTSFLEANLQNANLSFANLREVDMTSANLSNASLSFTNLEKAWLNNVNLNGGDISGAKLKDTALVNAKLIGANISEANLKGAIIEDTILQGANLNGTLFDSNTILLRTNLIGANLYNSYFDEAKSFRYATVFNDRVDQEINEIVGDALDSTLVNFLKRFWEHTETFLSKILSFEVSRITRKIPLYKLFSKVYVLNISNINIDIASEIREKGLFRYIKEGRSVLFFDISTKCLIEKPENKKRNKNELVKIEGLADLLIENGRIKSEFIYKGSRASQYEASYEVYNNLYNFYIANGRLDHAAHAHYRRGEVHRKLRWEQGGLRNRFRSIFDYLVLKGLTGYGDRLGRPVWFSGFVIVLFAALFRFFDGIVKNVNGTTVKPDWIDYLYHSITTFTSLGYSNIQPNLASGHIPQLLVAVESGLGITMMALIIFVITYQVSR